MLATLARSAHFTGCAPSALTAIARSPGRHDLLATGILQTAGHTSITAARTHHARDATRIPETFRLDPA
jgi:hypothetical protein